MTIVDLLTPPRIIKQYNPRLPSNLTKKMIQVSKFSLQNKCALQFQPINPKRAPISVLALSRERYYQIECRFCVFIPKSGRKLNLF
jgi:hypothetical protein